MRPLVFLQLNELNFEYVESYIRGGFLPHFKRLFDSHGFVETTSESAHELANPWIQWPTVHTGLDYEDHRVFRLGDIVDTNHPHIYETLEAGGLKVAALSAFNAKNNTRNSAFFVPDPWTRTRFDGSWSLYQLYRALCEVTDDYAKDTVAFRAACRLLAGGATHIRWRNLPGYFRDAASYLLQKKKWYRAIFCDRLLFDAFQIECKRHKPDFATLFLNGAAHLQHHYLFSALPYDGPLENPAWHVPPGEDPLLDILKLYDGIIGELLAQRDDIRLLIATGLHQHAHERVTYYYRLDSHASLLDRLGIDYQDTYRLMTEDFVVKFNSDIAARAAERRLRATRTIARTDIFYRETADRADRTLATADEIFHIENRGSDLYMQLKPTAIKMPLETAIRCGDVVVENFETLVSLAQYKNTHHVGIGYLTDTGCLPGELANPMPLKDTFRHIMQAFDLPMPGSADGTKIDYGRRPATFAKVG